MADTNEDMEKEQGTLIQRLRQIRLEIKILFLIIVCLTLGFGTYVIYSLNSESKALMHQHRVRSHLAGTRPLRRLPPVGTHTIRTARPLRVPCRPTCTRVPR